MQRREFFQQAGLALGAAGTIGAVGTATATATPRREAAPEFRPDDWDSVRGQFPLSPSYVHMSMFLLASHPRPVADAIERHRRAFDENPAMYFHEHFREMNPIIRAAAAEYMGGEADHIALTDSTTMGLGLVYGSIHLEPHQEMVCTTHCHYSTQMALQHRAQRTGAKTRQVPLYENPATTTVDEIVTNTLRAIKDNTRVFAVTWVHSCTGVKLPIKAMAGAIGEVNAGRDPKDRVIFCVDGVHGFGIEDVRIDDLGCDFFIAGTHKWIFGPRGTGVVWARPGLWETAGPIVPSFSPNYLVWMGELTPDQVPPGGLNSPGGFHSFEHRWALPEAFRFHLDIGKERVQERIHALNSVAKEALAAMPHVRLHTPMSPELSAGINCFEVKGRDPEEVVDFFIERKIVASKSPYRVSYPRLCPSLLNDEQDIDRSMEVLQAMA